MIVYDLYAYDLHMIEEKVSPVCLDLMCPDLLRSGQNLHPLLLQKENPLNLLPGMNFRGTPLVRRGLTVA